MKQMLMEMVREAKAKKDYRKVRSMFTTTRSCFFPVVLECAFRRENGVRLVHFGRSRGHTSAHRSWLFVDL